MLSIWEHENKMLKYISPSMELPASKIKPRLTLLSSNILALFLLLLQLQQSRKSLRLAFIPENLSGLLSQIVFLNHKKEK